MEIHIFLENGNLDTAYVAEKELYLWPIGP